MTSLIDITKLDLKEAKVLEKSLKSYIRALERKKDRKEYLKGWYENVFLELSSIAIKDEKVYKMSKRYFIKWANEDDYELLYGDNLGKHSYSWMITTTKWLQKEHKVYYVSSEHAEFWRVDTSPQTYKDPKKLDDVLKPITKKELMVMFAIIDQDKKDENYLRELRTYMHCKLFEHAYDCVQEILPECSYVNDGLEVDLRL